MKAQENKSEYVNDNVDRILKFLGYHHITVQVFMGDMMRREGGYEKIDHVETEEKQDSTSAVQHVPGEHRRTLVRPGHYVPSRPAGIILHFQYETHDKMEDNAEE